VAPAYPDVPREEKKEGTVVIRSVIDRDGNIAEMKVLRSLDEEYDDAAMDAIRQWKFRPALLDGKPVAVYYNLTINFRLGDKTKDDNPAT
jgi:protein TonB